MALAYAVRRRGSFGDMNYRIVDVTLDAADTDRRGRGTDYNSG
jgi:hypothetical protein